jgi:hypothetical protein
MRRIEGLMIRDQLIDIFRDTEFRVGNQKKRIFEKVPFKQLLNYKIKKNNLFFSIMRMKTIIVLRALKGANYLRL